MDLVDLGKKQMSRSSDPSYTQTFARVPKALVAKMKMLCYRKGITQSQAIDEAINLWLKQQGDKPVSETTERETYG